MVVASVANAMPGNVAALAKPAAIRNSLRFINILRIDLFRCATHRAAPEPNVFFQATGRTTVTLHSVQPWCRPEPVLFFCNRDYGPVTLGVVHPSVVPELWYELILRVVLHSSLRSHRAR